MIKSNNQKDEKRFDVLNKKKKKQKHESHKLLFLTTISHILTLQINVVILGT
jgi:hypothetical protein